MYNPYTEFFSLKPLIIGGNITPNNLVESMFNSIYSKGLKPHRDFQTYLREAKLFLREVDPEVAVELLLEAHRITMHAYGISFLRKLHNEKITSKIKPKRSKRIRL